jgi:hypothetical protein
VTVVSTYPELETASFDDLVEKWKGPPIDGANYARLFYSEVALSFRRFGDRGLNQLIAQTSRESGVKLASLVDGLSWPTTDDVRVQRLLVALLDNLDPSVVAAAIDALRVARTESPHVAIKRKLASQRDPIVVAAVLRYIAAISPDDALPALIESLSHRSPIVRETAADALGELARPDVVDRLTPLLKDPDKDVRQAARTSIQHLRNP